MRNFFALTCVGLVFIMLDGMVAPRPAPRRQIANPVIAMDGQALTIQPSVTTSPVVPTTLQPTSASTAVNTAGWATYTNSLLGFSIDYPLTMQLVTYKFTANNNGFDPVFFCKTGSFNTSLAICFYLPPGIAPGDLHMDDARATPTAPATRWDSTRAVLAVSTTNLDQQDCLVFPDNQSGPSSGSLSQETINGIRFSTVTTRGDEALGGWDTYVRSRAFVHDTCFELFRTIARSRGEEFATLGPITPTAEPARDPQYQFVQVIFDRMLASLRFISPWQPIGIANPTGPAAPSPTDTPTPASMAGWKTYTDSILGFSITYPPTMDLISFKQRMDTEPLCGTAGDSSRIICFFLRSGTYPDTMNTAFLGGTISMSTTNLDEQDCLAYSDWPLGVEAPKPSLINGIRFSTSKWGGAGMGKGVEDIFNRTFVRNTCFELTLTREWLNFTEFIPTSTPGFTPTPYPNYQNIQALLDQVLATFRFTSSQASAANP